MITIVILLLPSCILSKSNPPVKDRTGFRVLSVKELYPQAEETAREWQEDAYLYRVMLDVYPEINSSTITATFFFRSYAFPDTYYFNRFIMSDITVIKQHQGIFKETPPHGLEIHPETLPFDSFEALGFMYDEFGKDFYKDCRVGRWPLFLKLEQRIPALAEGELAWSMSYNCLAPEEFAAIFIKADTGEVLEIRK
jgi:hypothetical protein